MEASPELHPLADFLAGVEILSPFSREEMERLVVDLSVTETPYFCPHGRPIVSRVSLHDIRRELKRTW